MYTLYFCRIISVDACLTAWGSQAGIWVRKHLQLQSNSFMGAVLTSRLQWNRSCSKTEVEMPLSSLVWVSYCEIWAPWLPTFCQMASRNRWKQGWHEHRFCTASCPPSGIFEDHHLILPYHKEEKRSWQTLRATLIHLLWYWYFLAGSRRFWFFFGLGRKRSSCRYIAR